jgi:uncharacterized protein (TIGR02996 family)
VTTEDDFSRALDAAIDDWQTRLVFADWLEEQGDPRAEGYRALGLLRKHPTHPDEDGCFWMTKWSCRRDVEGILDHEVLPDDWFDLATKPNEPAHVSERSRRDLEDEVAHAFARLPAQRRAQLLAITPS